MPKATTKTKPEADFDFEQQNKKAALIVASENFRDEEYFVPKEILKRSGMEVKTVSDSEGQAKGSDGGKVEVDLTLNELDINNFDIIAFVGGPGALDHLDNEKSYDLIREVLNNNKVLGAICIAPVILAKAGVLNDKEVTVWNSSMDREPIQIVEDEGANYHDRSVVIDKNIVTADGPQSARKFGIALLHALTKI